MESNHTTPIIQRATLRRLRQTDRTAAGGVYQATSGGLAAALCLLTLPLLLAATGSAAATVRYVNVNNANPTPPYTSWATAATNIQAAVNAAAEGDAIVVTNGVYTPVTVNTPLTLQSAHGPAVTLINGGGTAQCVYLTNGAAMAGFTLTNGFAGTYGTYGSGGGVYCLSQPHARARG
jgi:uncharacterized iron-regulated membrane protein